MAAVEGRSWLPQNPAAAFLQNRTTLGEVVPFDSGLDVFVEAGQVARTNESRRVLAIWKGIDSDASNLYTALATYQDKLIKDGKYKGPALNFHAMKWEETFSQIAKAAEEHRHESYDGPKRVVQRSLRKMNAHARALETWATLIPGGDYGSCISGAFFMFATAARRSADIKELVAEVMADIPDVLEQNKSYIDSYKSLPKDQLTKATARLVQAIFITLRLIVEYLTKSSTKRALGALGKGEGFEKKLEDGIEDIRRLAANARNEADALLHRRIESMSKELTETKLMVKQQCSDTSNVALAMNQMYRLLLSNPNLVQDGGETKRIEDVPDASDTAGASGTTHMSLVPKGPGKIELLEALNFDAKSLKVDIEKCRSLQFTLGPTSKDIATHIIQSKQVKRWITEATLSGSLLVNTNRSSTAMNDISAVSVVSAELVAMFKVIKPVVIVGYFCGLHADINDEEWWGVDMMRSLIGQIILQNEDRRRSYDLSFIREEDLRLVEDGDIEGLCRVFRKLLEQISSHKVVVCILDSISRYEISRPGGQDANEILNFLTDLVHGGKSKAIIKILLTSPSKSAHIGLVDERKSVVVDDVLEVPELVDGARQGVFNAEGIEEYLYI